MILKALRINFDLFGFISCVGNYFRILMEIAGKAKSLNTKKGTFLFLIKYLYSLNLV